MGQGSKVLVLGGVIIDKYMVVERFPQRGQDILVTDAFERVGGCSINVAVTLKNLGCEPYIVSAIGDDHDGEWINRYLTDKSLALDCIRVLRGGKSGYCLTIVDKLGERTFMTYHGCEGFFSSEMMSEKSIRNADFIYLTGYYLLHEAYHCQILQNISRLKETGSKLVFDPGPLVAEIKESMLLSVLKASNVVVPNTAEANVISKRLGITGAFHAWCIENGVDLVVVKAGSRGVKAWDKDKSYLIPCYKVKTLDTTGAGDSFAGGLIYGFINNFSIEESLKFASACGAITTTFMGPHGKFDLMQIRELMDDGKGVNNA